jgi:hypothetical protein
METKVALVFLHAGRIEIYVLLEGEMVGVVCGAERIVFIVDRGSTFLQ